ncbi:hypothetical protein D9M68_732400 [compost metagenome]
MLGVLAVAVHVDGQGAVAEGREVTGAALGVVVEAPPLVDDHHAGTLAGNGVVVGVVTDQGCTVRALVGDLAGLDLGLDQAGAEQQRERQGDSGHGASLQPEVLKNDCIQCRGFAGFRQRRE